MKTSVVIPSYNPQLKLLSTLESLLPQSSFIDELIIIIDNNNHGSIATQLTAKYSNELKAKIFTQANSGRAKSRNRGAELSSGDIIIFLDDDMLAEENLIKKHIEYHTENSDIIISGNGYRNPAGANYDFGKFLVKMEKGWKTNTIDKGEISYTKFNFTACNMSLPKSVFNQLSGFDTRFTDGEDFDFAVRALQQNIKILYDKTLLAWHNDWPTIELFIKRQNEYNKVKGELLKIHPEYLKYFPHLILKPSSNFKIYISKFIRVLLGKWVISDGVTFKMLPSKIKFMFYTSIISAYSNINI